jgi:hypothetical protein
LDRLRLPDAREAAVEIHKRSGDARDALEHARGAVKLIGAHAEIDVAIRPQRAIGIAARDGPTLDQHGLDAFIV